MEKANSCSNRHALLHRHISFRPQLRSDEACRETTADRPIYVQLELSADMADNEANDGYVQEAGIGDDEKGHDRRLRFALNRRILDQRCPGEALGSTLRP
jgi:hypothetical protein